jgi:hypothetical protein
MVWENRNGYSASFLRKISSCSNCYPLFSLTLAVELSRALRIRSLRDRRCLDRQFRLPTNITTLPVSNPLALRIFAQKPRLYGSMGGGGKKEDIQAVRVSNSEKSSHSPSQIPKNRQSDGDSLNPPLRPNASALLQTIAKVHGFYR